MKPTSDFTRNFNDPDLPAAVILTQDGEKGLAQRQLSKYLSGSSFEAYAGRQEEIAVNIHAYYIDIFEEIAEMLSQTVLWNCDWYINTDDTRKANTIRLLLDDRIRKENTGPRYHVITTENRGRNLLCLARSGIELRDSHAYILHIHTKKTADPNGVGNHWRKDLFAKICGSNGQIKRALELLRHEKTGLVLPSRFGAINHHYNWGGNFALASALYQLLLRRIRHTTPKQKGNYQSKVDAPESLDKDCLLVFPAGMMFWFRPNALAPLFELLELKQDELTEPLAYRGTLAHAAERLICHCCELQGYRWRIIDLESKNGDEGYGIEDAAMVDTNCDLSVFERPVIESSLENKEHNGMNTEHVQKEHPTELLCQSEGDKTLSITQHQSWRYRSFCIAMACGNDLKTKSVESNNTHIDQRIIYSRREALLICRCFNRLRKIHQFSSIVLSIISSPFLTNKSDTRILLWTIIGDLNRCRLKGMSKKLVDWERERRCIIEARAEIVSYIKNTHTYREVEKRHDNSKAHYLARILERPEVLKSVLSSRAERILFWHHYDPSGFVPRSWFNLLVEARQKGWLVLASTSHMTPNDRERLHEFGIRTIERKNIGLCLCAYKDFLLLLTDCVGGNNGKLPKTMIMCNDSILPVVKPYKVIDIFDQWHSINLCSEEALMQGMTDSVQMNAYHIQTYCFAVNQKVLSSQVWHRFWTNFSPEGEKIDLVKRGEIGLSQDLLEAGIQIQCEYSLIDLLLKSDGIGTELAELHVNDIRNINPSIFAWRSLLASGYPFVKKQTLFETCEGRKPTHVSLSQLRPYLSNCDIHELSADIQRLLQTRFMTHKHNSRQEHIYTSC